jgi:hypothetical protein
MSNEKDKQSSVVSVLAVIAVIVLVGLGVWAYDRGVSVAGVGSADLDIEFSVVDSNTRSPIPDARIEIQQRHGGLQAENLALRTDGAGKAHRDCPESTVLSRESGLCFTNTRTVLPPEIAMRVSADGYEPREWGSLGIEFGKDATSVEVDGKDRFPVRIEMRKAKR